MAEEKAPVVLSDEVKSRLDKMDWKALEAATGVKRAQIEKNPALASQLAYQQVTDLVFGSTPDISGQYALRAIPTKKDDELWKIKAYTIETAKKPGDRLFLFGSEIYSEPAKKALLEMNSWNSSKGERVRGYANANAGRPIALEMEQADGTKKKTEYLVSLHRPTNRLFAMPVDAVKSMYQNEDGTAKDVSMYGVKLTDKQVDELCKGGYVVLKGTQRKDGTAFETYPGIGTAVQFDVTARQLVAVHPVALSQVMKAGVGGPAEEAAKPEVQPEVRHREQKPAVEQAPENKERKLRR